MATWVLQTSALRLPLRLDLLSWAPRRSPLTFYKNLAISTPYPETSPMVALRQHPISSAPLNPSIFEVDDEEEYKHVALSLPPLSQKSTLSAPPDPSSILVRLIKAGQFGDANRVRSEMTQMDLHINPSRVYEQAALHALEAEEQEREYRLTNFLGWLALIPSRKWRRSVPKFDRFLYLLLEKHPHDIEFITRFAITCVSKGYTQTFPQRIVPFIVRFAEPSVSLAFLDELRTASLQYKHVKLSRLRPKLKRWYSQAVRGYIMAHRLPYAVMALQLAESHEIDLTHFTYSFLLHHLKKDEGDPSEAIEHITTLSQQKEKSYIPFLSASSNQPSPDPVVISEQVDPFAYHSSHDTDLVATLRHLWRTVGTSQHPSAVVLAQFLDSYISSSGSLKAIQLLRRKTYRAGVNYRARWAMAEMLYYGKQKQWPQLLSTFDDYFYSSGVPAELHTYKRLPADRRLRDTRGLQARMFPSIFHTCLVWRALVEITKNTPTLHIIYHQLVSQAEAMSVSTPPPPPNDSTPLSTISPPPSQASDAAHFTPFLYVLFRKSLTNVMMSIFSDMARLGIEPRLPHWALLAGAHAFRGDFGEAYSVLETVENVLDEERQTQAGDVVSGFATEEELQRYLVLYLPAFSGFLYRKHLRGALMIKERLLKLGYVKRSNKLVEDNLAQLEEIQRRQKSNFV